MKEQFDEHLPEFFSVYFKAFQFVDVIVQQKPGQQKEIFAYFCHAPVPPKVIIALASEAREMRKSTGPEQVDNQSISPPINQGDDSLLEAVTYLQSLTPFEKYQLFISNSENVEKITWARFKKYRWEDPLHRWEDPLQIDTKALEKELEEKKLHLIHGHTKGYAERATNLDSPWGKSPDQEVGNYLASVHHTGGEQLTEIKQTYFNYTADLEKHPSLEKNITQSGPVDTNLLGIVHMEENDTLELGDMHANALRLTYHLIKHGVFEIDVEKYNEMVTLYNNISTLFTTINNTEYLKRMEQHSPEYGEKETNEIKEKHLAFKNLIDRITITKTPIKLKLIGDLLADRGASDILMEWLIIKLGEAKSIDLTILASNHDRAYFTEPGQKRDSALPPDYNQRRSLDNAVKIREKDPANEIKGYKLPESNNSINHSLTPVQLTTSLEKILRSPFTWAILTAALAAYPIYDCTQSKEVNSLSTVFDHLIHHGTLTLVLSVVAAACLLITAGVTLYSLCAKNNSDSAGFLLNQG